MIKIVADDKIPFLAGVLEPFAEVLYVPGHLISSEHLKSAQGLIIRTRTICNARLLENTTIKFIASATIGFDHIDAQFCLGKGIDWTNAPGCNSGSVQQYMASVLMHIELKEQRPLCDMTIGIIGVGNVGKKVEKLARALGMKVLLNDPPRERIEGPSEFVNLDQLLNQSDIVTLHVPLYRDGPDRTYHLTDRSFFKKMKPQSWLINASRGEICNSIAIKEAYENNILADMVLDVWENEPLIDLDLLQKCFIGTPHIAGYSVDGKANGTSMAVQACSRYFGFRRNSWYPANLPKPDNTLIDLKSSILSHNEAVRKAILSSYDICKDDCNLKANPLLFEKLRGEYPTRREFHAYSIIMDPSRTELSELLSDIGFNILTS
jgi:erythronate-4-phosphate dehydrogenase